MTKETQIIEIANCKLELSKNIISDTKKVEIFTKELDGISKIALDYSTKEKIKEAKQLRTKANKFVNELKDFCGPLEAEGQRIKDARSFISTKLNKSKGSVIEALLAPIDEREAKIRSIKDKLFIPSLDANSNASKLAEIDSLKDYEWFGFAEDILPIMEQNKQFLLNEKIKFEQEALVEAAYIKEEEEKRIEVITKAVEAKFSQSQEIVKALKAMSTINVEHKKKIHNETLSDLTINHHYNEEEAKSLIRAIASGGIKNLKIIY